MLWVKVWRMKLAVKTADTQLSITEERNKER
jgi:hypothetical protein